MPARASRRAIGRNREPRDWVRGADPTCQEARDHDTTTEDLLGSEVTPVDELQIWFVHMSVGLGQTGKAVLHPARQAPGRPRRH